MGILGATSRRAASIEVDEVFVDQTPFLVSPDDSRVLYAWPFYLVRRAEHSQQQTLYAFEEILIDQSRYLTGLRSCAIASLDPWEQVLREDPQDSFEWLLQELSNRPALQLLPKDLRLADDLLPSRGNLVGKWLGPYFLEARIATGGFATIYSARTHEEDAVAVKVLDLRDQEPFQDFVSRFEREFDKLRSAGKDHPGIIRCYERGLGLIDKDDYPYYSMEFADGGDLSAQIGARRVSLNGKIPWNDDEARAEVIEEFRAILAAVAHLHAKMNFVHRDIKPSNLLLVGGRLRLADFGLVKDLRPSERRISSGPPGTPFYRAPEQEKGEEVGRPADVYALGVLLAELATSTFPEPKTDATVGSTLGQYRDLKKVPDRLREAYANLEKLPEGLLGLIHRCTDVLAERRPQDAMSLQREFEKVVSILVTHVPEGLEAAQPG
jgi:serine/threonine protein kinase